MKNQTTTRENTIKDGLLAQQKIIRSLLGDREKSNKFLATAVKVANDYKLRECHTQSIIDACVNVAQLGLDLSPSLAHAYLVPFKAKKDAKVANVQLIISARGYTALLSRTGWKIKSYIVHEDDLFKYKIDGFDESVVFEKNLDSENDSFKYAVALAQSPDGMLYVEVMNKKQIEKHRLTSQNQSGNPSGVWKDWYDEMALKTVIKKLVKKLPLGEDVAKATLIDDKPIEAEISTDTQGIQETKPSLNEIQHNTQTGEIIEREESSKLDTCMPQFIKAGIKRTQIDEFCKRFNITDENVESILSDRDGFNALVAEFNAVEI